MSNDDIVAKLPPYYASRVRPALIYQDSRVIRDLVGDLTTFKNAHAEVALYQERLLDKYKTPEMREGREGVLGDCERSAHYCREMERVAGSVIVQLSTL